MILLFRGMAPSPQLYSRSRLRFAHALCVLALTACGAHTTHNAASSGVASNRPVVPSQRTADYLRTEPAAPATDGHTRSLVARVAFDERHLARIGPPVQGRVATVNVVTGDRVTQGQVVI